MENREKNLDVFFNQYERLFNNGLNQQAVDVDTVAQWFAGCFVEASPVGIICGKNDDGFRKKIPEGYDFYRKAGITSMNILMKDIRLLDDFHALCKIHWSSAFTKKDGSKGSIEFDVTYFVQTKDGAHKIFAYITGDEQRALKEHGLV